MRNEPEAAALLELAREVLLGDLAPELPAQRRYDLLMVAAAMAIAARELKSGGAAPALERQKLLALFGKSDSPRGGETAEETLERLSRRLAAEIRRGERDGNDELHRLLTEVMTAYLRESNPKVLAKRADREK